MSSLQKSIKQIHPNDKTWLVGFIEAEGSFTVAARNKELQFVITQGYRNLFILYYIQELLGYGKIAKQSAQVFRFVVQDKENLGNIIDLLNGCLVFEKRKAEFKRFLETYNLKFKANKVFLNSEVMPTLDDAWFSGFADGDGCFNISYITPKKRFYVRFSLSQLENLEPFIKVWGAGSVEHNPINGSYSFVIKDLCTAKNPLNLRVFEYFDRFRLKTNKLNSYCLYKFIAKRLWDPHQPASDTMRASLMGLCKLINNFDVAVDVSNLTPLNDSEEK